LLFMPPIFRIVMALTTRQLRQKREAAYPSKRIIHVFLDNARSPRKGLAILDESTGSTG